MEIQIIKMIHKQINMELFSAYLYYHFANYYSEINLDGFENWFTVQAQEELDHALLFSQYLHDNDEKVALREIHSPDCEIPSIISPLKIAYGHEQKMTVHINEIYSTAFEGKDFRTTQLLDWFIKEQGEEEKIFRELISKMELFGNDPKSLYLLNTELAARVYTAPTLTL